MNTYDIYRNGELLKENVTMDFITETTGLVHQNLTRYLDFEKSYLAKDKNYYSFKFRNQEKDYELRMPPSFADDWNNMLSAVEGIKKGTHHIVTEYIKGRWVRHTEVKR